MKVLQFVYCYHHLQFVLLHIYLIVKLVSNTIFLVRLYPSDHDKINNIICTLRYVYVEYTFIFVFMIVI